MKHTLLALLTLFIIFSAVATETEYDHIFFDNCRMEGRYYFSRADYQSPSYILNEQHKLLLSNDHFFTAKNALQLDYVSANGGQWTASVIYPESRGKDFIKASQFLDFRMWIESENTRPEELPAIAICKIDQSKKDTTGSDFISLEKYVTFSHHAWIHVHIPLNAFKNLSYSHSKEIKQIIFKQQSNDGKQHHLYIDQLELVPEILPQNCLEIPSQVQTKAYEKHIDLTWDKTSTEKYKYIKIYRAEENQKDFSPVGIQAPSMGRFTDYTGETNKNYRYKIAGINYDYSESKPSDILTATTYPMTDEQLLDMIQEASFRYYWEGAEPHSGLALENIPGRKSMVASGASGFGLMAIITATERGYISREQATERMKKIISYLEKAERFHGAYSHFINGEDGKVVPFFGKKDNGADLVETAFLFQGLLTARQYFNHNTSDEKIIRDKITQLWKDVEWDWFKKTKDSKYIYWHWSPDQEWVINHQLIGWNETMIVYLLAMASPTHAIDKSIYYSGWASQEQEAKGYRSSWGQTNDGEDYSNGNTYFGIKLDVGVSSGGPLFFIHYSYMGFNPHGIKDKYTDKDYFNTFRNMALINYRYCLENPKRQIGYGPECWGLTASDGPWGYHAAEPAQHQDDGTIAPTGALASFPYTPEQSMTALKNYYHNYGHFLWGEYGFLDAFNLNENWCADIYMGLNQAPVTVMIENYRSGLIWNLFMSNPEINKMVNNVFEKEPGK